MKPKKIFGVYLLNIAIFLFLGAICFAFLVFKASSARFPAFSAPNSLLVAFVMLVLQTAFASIVNQRLQTKKQIVLVNVSVLITFLVLMVVQVIPIMVKREYCLTIIHSESEEVGECMTFMENSRAAVVYIIAIFYVFWYTANALGLQLFLFLTKDKLKIVFFVLLSLVINSLIFMLLFSGQKAMINKNNIQVKPFPGQIAPTYQLKINDESQLIDPNIHQLQEMPATVGPSLNLEYKD